MGKKALEVIPPMISSRVIKQSIGLIDEWLLESGIQNFDTQDEHFGGFNAWYDVGSDSYPFIYAEITGYLTTLLLFLFNNSARKKYLERAKISGDWILRNLSYHGVIPCLFPVARTIYHLKVNWAYAFDNGVVINSLTNLYKSTGNQKYLEKAQNVADWLLTNLQKNDGSFFFAYNVITQEKLIDEESYSWSTTSGSFLGKIAIGLLNLYDQTKIKRYKLSAIRLLKYCLCYQTKEGNFYSYPTLKGTHLHPHTYTLESLLISGLVLHNNNLVRRAIVGLQWNFSLQREDGEFPRQVFDGKIIYRERTDILAQSLRLAVLLRNLKLLDATYDEKIEIGLKRLLGLQDISQNRKARGGIRFGFGEYTKPTHHINVWVTAFTLQLMIYYLERKNKKKLFKLDHFLFV